MLMLISDVDEFEGFTKVYNRARSLFCDDSTLLDKFGALKTHLERVEFMSELQVIAVKGTVHVISSDSPFIK